MVVTAVRSQEDLELVSSEAGKGSSEEPERKGGRNKQTQRSSTSESASGSGSYDYETAGGGSHSAGGGGKSEESGVPMYDEEELKRIAKERTQFLAERVQEEEEKERQAREWAAQERRDREGQA